MTDYRDLAIKFIQEQAEKQKGLTDHPALCIILFADWLDLHYGSGPMSKSMLRRLTVQLTNKDQS